VTTPRRSATLLVAMATRVLPSGPVRERYRKELTSELHDLDRSRQLRHAMGTAAHALALRRALADGEHRAPTTATHAAPLHCRLHLYHHHRKATTEDGQVFLECVGCGHIKDNYVDPAGPSISSHGLPMPMG
jgi:hypothetical protein